MNTRTPATPPLLRKYHELDGRTFLVGVGANKCGTSWVYRYLSSLSGVVASPLKELHFFNANFHSTAEQMDLFAIKRAVFHFKQEGDVVGNLRSRPSFQASIDRVKMIYDDNAYFDHFARICAPDTRTLCDITPAYSGIGRSGFEYMREFVASQDVSLKILFIMRDPVDRLWSHLRYRQQHDPSRDLLKSWSEMIQDPELFGWTDYRQTVEAMDAVFSDRQVLFLFFEDLFSEATLKKLCAFAGAAYLPPKSNEAVNETELKIDLPDGVRDELVSLLAPQYAFCRQRFGNRVPDAWRA